MICSTANQTPPVTEYQNKNKTKNKRKNKTKQNKNKNKNKNNCKKHCRFCLKTAAFQSLSQTFSKLNLGFATINCVHNNWVECRMSVSWSTLSYLIKKSVFVSLIWKFHNHLLHGFLLYYIQVCRQRRNERLHNHNLRFEYHLRMTSCKPTKITFSES